MKAEQKLNTTLTWKNKEAEEQWNIENIERICDLFLSAACN